ncbi:hypothetical protein DMA11_04300 [Marinilabiliaceae bacterium JC017]|nr:hypothetical protein DMA11_04300 [Marinilabiliaceae bacterium JC017]
MFSEIKEGLQISKEKVVKNHDLASTMCTGKVEVLATPAMIAFMEQCCVALVEPLLPEGYDSVSVEMNVKHVGAAKEGVRLKCNVHLKYRDNNKLFFDVAIMDENHQKIGIGAHERYIVNHQEFTDHL